MDSMDCRARNERTRCSTVPRAVLPRIAAAASPLHESVSLKRSDLAWGKRKENAAT